MRTDDIVALVILTGLGVGGYLWYTKQIDLDWLVPEDLDKMLRGNGGGISSSNGGSGNGKKEDDNDDKVIKEMDDTAPKANDEPKSKPKIGLTKEGLADFLSDPFKGGKDILGGLDSGGLADFLSDPFKEGKRLIGNLIPSNNNNDNWVGSARRRYTNTSTKASPSLSSMIENAFKGHGFRPYKGSSGSPYA